MFIVWLAVLVVLFIVFVSLDRWHMTTVQEGSMKFVVRGEDYLRTLLNVRGYQMSPDQEEIRKSGGVINFSPLRWFGLYWVSLFYPLRRLHRFNLVTGSLLPEEERKDKPFKEWVVAKPHDTDRLDLRIRSYGTITNIELKDRFNVDLLVFALLEIVNPRLAIFTYKADFVKILEAATFSGYVDRVKNRTFESFVRMGKGRGTQAAAKTCEYINSGGGSKVSTDDLEKLYGVRLVETFVYDYQLSADQGDVVKASKAKEVATLNAEAAVETAKGEAAAINVRAQAEADRIGKALKAMTDLKVSPDAASGDYATVRATDKGAPQTWVQRGAVNVNIGDKNDGGGTP